MTVAAAIRITSPDEARVIEHAAEFAALRGARCFVISVVKGLPHIDLSDEVQAIVQRNLELILAAHASPVIQQGNDIAAALLAVARGFGVKTLFLQSGTSHRLGRSIAEQILHLEPPFDVFVIGSD